MPTNAHAGSAGIACMSTRQISYKMLMFQETQGAGQGSGKAQLQLKQYSVSLQCSARVNADRGTALAA